MRIAIDPGGTTGIAIRTTDGTILTVAEKNPLGVYDLFKMYGPQFEVVICEDFVAQHIDNYMRATIRLVGAISALAYIYNAKLYIQAPQTRKGFISRAKQQLKDKNVVIHEIDAFAHLLAWESLNQREIKK